MKRRKDLLLYGDKDIFSQNKKDLAENLKLIREYRKLSQQKVTNILHVDRSTYIYYEVAKTEPDIFTIIKLAEFFNVELMDLVPKNGAINVRVKMKS